MRTNEGKNGIEKGRILFALKIILPILCLLTMGFIFSNSLQTGEESAEQSSAVVSVVQNVAAAIDPDSPIANATGDAYAKLHAVVRNLAHYLEFALLGALFCWTYYVFKPTKKYLYIPLLAVLIAPLIDEGLQLFVAGRDAEWKDVFVDTLGGVTGFAFALFAIWAIAKILCKINRKKDKSGGA